MEKSTQLGVILIGLIGGIAVGIQGPMSGIISQRLGPISTSLIIHIGGVVVSTGLLILIGGERFGEWRRLPVPLFLAGALGPILYVTLSFTLPRLGAGGSVVLLVAGQLAFALLIDQFGWFGFPQRSVNQSQVIGSVLLLVSIYLLKR